MTNKCTKDDSLKPPEIWLNISDQKHKNCTQKSRPKRRKRRCCTGFIFPSFIFNLTTYLYIMFYAYTCNGVVAKCTNDNKLSIIYSGQQVFVSLLYALHIQRCTHPSSRFICIWQPAAICFSNIDIILYKYKCSVYDDVFSRHTFYLHNGVFINVGNIFRVYRIPGVWFFLFFFLSGIIY